MHSFHALAVDDVCILTENKTAQENSDYFCFLGDTNPFKYNPFLEGRLAGHFLDCSPRLCQACSSCIIKRTTLTVSLPAFFFSSFCSSSLLPFSLVSHIHFQSFSLTQSQVEITARDRPLRHLPTGQSNHAGRDLRINGPYRPLYQSQVSFITDDARSHPPNSAAFFPLHFFLIQSLHRNVRYQPRFPSSNGGEYLIAF